MTAEAEYARRALASMWGQVAVEAFGLPRPPELDPGENDYEFVTKQRLTIDGKRFDIDHGFKHQRELYEDPSRDQTVMAGAQTGKTAWLLQKLFRIGIIEWKSNVAAYYPDYHLPRAFSRDRFAPMGRGNPMLAQWLGRTGRINPRTGHEEHGTDQVLTRSFGPTTFYFLSVAGRSSTEGLPMKAVAFDEVRRMSEGDIQRAEERTSGQYMPWILRVSTACLPESDIHKYFLQGDQRFFHTDCRCPDGIVLSRAWPDCVLDMRTASETLQAEVRSAYARAKMPYLGMQQEEITRYGEAVYRCPKCGTILVDPRRGWWEAEAPSHFGSSYQLPQLLSVVWPAARVLSFWRRPGVDMQEFWNSKLGLPYIDKDATPITLDDLWRSVNKELAWPALQSRDWRRTNLKKTAMGVDVQKGYNVVVIKEVTASGRYRTIHVEVAGPHDQWKRCARLMAEFDVRYCVVDSAPEFDAARRFALAHRGRVYLAQYVESQTGKMVSWADKKGSDQRGETAFKYTVNINRTRAFQWSLHMWAHGECEIPDPAGLVQALPRSGGKVVLTANLGGGAFEATRIVEQVYFLHLTRVIFVRELPADDPDGLSGVYRLSVQHVGLDPHFAHADLYADVALSRLTGRVFDDDEG